MVGRKRIAMLEKVTESVIFVGTCSAERVLKYCVHTQTIDRRFSRKNACFPLMIVVRNLAPNVESAGGANQGINSVVGKTRVAIHFFGICRHSWRNGAIRGEESSGRCRQCKLSRAVSPTNIKPFPPRRSCL